MLLGSVHPWCRDWLASLDRQGLRPNTVKGHQRKLDRLFAYIQTKTGLPPNQVNFRALLELFVGEVCVGQGPIDTRFLADFLQWHVQDGEKPVTEERESEMDGDVLDPDAWARKRNDMIYSLRLFFRWCVKHHHLLADPSYHLEPGVVTRRVNHRKYLTVEETTFLYQAAGNSGKHTPRNFAIVATLLLAGLRPGELVGMTPTALDFKNGWIKADGKTGEGAAPMPPALADVLRRYLKSSYYRELSKGNDSFPLFPNNRGTAGMSTQYLNLLIRRLCLSGGIDRGVTTYWMRHTFATQAYRMGLSFVNVSAGLRHVKLKNTQVYVHGREDRMRKIALQTPTAHLLAEVHRDLLGLTRK